jgi:hypothetical protein
MMYSDDIIMQHKMTEFSGAVSEDRKMVSVTKVIYVPELPLRLNLMKYSRAVSRVRDPMMRTEMALETSVS